MKANSIEEYFGTLLQASVEGHKAHLRAEKLNVHLAWDGFYGSLQWRMDEIIEKYQGIHGKIKEFKNVLELGEKSDEEYLNELREFVESGKEIIEEKEIHSSIDEILGNIDSVLYKLKELKEGRVPAEKISGDKLLEMAARTAILVMKEAKDLTPTEKIQAWKDGERDENVKACAPDKLRQYHKLAKNMGFDAGAKEIEDVAASKGVKLDTDNLVEAVMRTVKGMVSEMYGEPSNTPYKDELHDIFEEADANTVKELALSLVYWLNDDRDAMKFMEANQIPFCGPGPAGEEGIEEEGAAQTAAPAQGEQVIEDEFKAPKPEYFRGVEGVEMIWHGEWADPELRYGDYVANYWTVEDAMYQACKEEFGADADSDEVFNKYCQDHRDDVIEYIMSSGKKEGEEEPAGEEPVA